MLLGWLHSHTDAYLEKLTCNVARRALRTSSVKSWLGELEQAGFLKVAWPEAKGTRISVMLLAEPWEKLFAPRRNRRAETGAVSEPKPAREGEQGEDQSRKTPAAPSSPQAKKEKSAKRILAEELVRDWWESRTIKPAGSFIGYVKVIEGLEGKGWAVSQIRQALREVPACTHAALDMWLSKQGKDTCGPAEAKHRHAGKIAYDGANNRVQFQDDGTTVIIATAEEVAAETTPEWTLS